MSHRVVIASVIALAFVAVIAAWWMREERAAAQATAPALIVETPPAQPTPFANTPNSAAIPQAARTTSERAAIATATEPIATPPATEPVLCTVFGFVKPDPGSQLADDVGIAFTDRLGQRELAHADRTGAYSISGLALGTWWVNCGSQEARARARIDLDASQPTRRLDLTLIAAPQVRLKVTTPSGEPAPARGLFGVATSNPPGEWFEEVRGSWNNTFGVGAWRYEQTMPTPPFIGSIVLDVEPPVYVSLLRYHRVLATVRVETRGDDAEFVLDPNSPLLADATVRARAVDSAGGAPMAEAYARLERSSGEMSRPDPALPGIVSFSALEPGRYDLVFVAKGFAEYRAPLLLEPGAALDLGDIPMHPELSIEGVVVDEAGQPIETTLRCDVFDRARGRTVRTMITRGYKVDSNGHFRVAGLMPSEFLLAIDDRESRFGRCVQLVDTRRGSVEGMRLVAARGVQLVVHPAGDEFASVHYTVRNSDQLPVLSTRLWSAAPVAFRLAPGAYTVEVELPYGAAPLVHEVVLTDEPVELALP